MPQCLAGAVFLNHRLSECPLSFLKLSSRGSCAWQVGMVYDVYVNGSFFCLFVCVCVYVCQSIVLLLLLTISVAYFYILDDCHSP